MRNQIEIASEVNNSSSADKLASVVRENKNNRSNFLKFCAAFFAVGIVLFGCDKDDGDSGGDKVKLLETTYYDGYLYQKFEYDAQNRITKIYYYNDGEIDETYTFTYNSAGDLTSMSYIDTDNSDDNYTTNITYAGNKITFDDDDSFAMDLNPDGLLIKVTEEYGDDDLYTWDYVYQNGNLTKATQTDKWWSSPAGGGTYRTVITASTFTYDDMKSPLNNCNTPKWVLIWQFEGEIGIKNNPKIRTSKSIDSAENAEFGNVYESTHESTSTYTYTYDDEGYPLTCTAKWVDDDGDEHDWNVTYTYITK